MERHAFYIVLLSIVGILWYVSIWGIFEGLIEFIETKYKVHKRYQYIFVIAAILIIILIHPEILDTL